MTCFKALNYHQCSIAYLLISQILASNQISQVKSKESKLRNGENQKLQPLLILKDLEEHKRKNLLRKWLDNPGKIRN